VRILYLHQYFVPPGASGGTRSYEFAKRLVANGHEVCLVTSSAMLPEPYRSIERTSLIEVAGIPLVVIPVPYSNEMSFTRRIIAFLRFAALASREAVRYQADVVFASSTPLTIAIPGLIARIWQRIPMVFEVRDLWPEKPIAIGALRNPIIKWLAQILEWVAYHSSAHIVALSPEAKRSIEKRGILPDRVSVIPNSCDLELFDIPASGGQPIRERLGLTFEQPLVVYTGAFGYINGVNYAVDMAKFFQSTGSNIHILLIGTGRERENILDHAKKFGVLNHSLSIWDPIPKEQMPRILAAATLATSFVIPVKPLWDNSANKFFDALAAGKPIAINYGGWQADLLRETGAGIVLPPDDPSEGARQIAAFLRDGPRLQTASRAARRLARTRFDRNMAARELENILRSVVGEKFLDGISPKEIL